MLLLVMANNYLLLYVGWEGVGLASYLLIGFWQHKRSPLRQPQRRLSLLTGSVMLASALQSC